MSEKDHTERLLIGEYPLELQAAKEQPLIGCGAFFHDARDPGKVVREQREGLGAAGELPVAYREGERTVQGDDQPAAGLALLQLLEEDEQERLDPLILVEPAVTGMPVRFLVADAECDRADERWKRRRASDRTR